jgi:CPA2 family monovalent cation:H+ antiporter-2
METAFLSDIVIICGLSVAVVYLCKRLKIPNIIAFLLTGMLAGPHVLGLVHSPHEVEVLAELGVVLLLFTIGLEFSFGDLIRMKRPLLLGGSVQVAATGGIVLGAGMYFGIAWGQSVFLGFMAALSSTAIVLKLLEERSLMGSPQGRNSLAILLFQDIIVVAMLLVAPLLAGDNAVGQVSGLNLFLRGMAAVVVLGLAAKWGVGKLLDTMASHRDREMFSVTIALVLLGVAWLTSWAGLSLALGAFIAGLIVAESQYGHQTVSSVLPMRDLFTSIFFVSVGMLLDVGFLLENPVLVAALTLIILAVKTFTGGLASMLLGYNLRISLAVGLSLSQVGEFSFVLAKTGQNLGLITAQNFQLALAASVLTMMLTPATIWLGQRVASRSRPDAKEMLSRKRVAKAADRLSGHLVIVGYGINGRNVSLAAETVGIPYIILEMNPRTVRKERQEGKPIFYGDAVNQAVLEHAGLSRAQALVVALADPAATRRIVAASRSAHPGLYIIARTRYMQEVESLIGLGADEVIPEEYETSLEIFSRVLRRFGTAEGDIEHLKARLRAEGYELLRRADAQVPQMAAKPTCSLGNDFIATVRIQGGSKADGGTLQELGLRKDFSINVLALQREGELITNIDPDQALQSDDLLMVLADPEKMAIAQELFLAPKENDAEAS